MNGTVGRQTSFEVTINNVQVYSKLENGNFPDFEEVVQRVLDASLGKEVKPCVKLGASGKCSLL